MSEKKSRLFKRSRCVAVNWRLVCLAADLLWLAFIFSMSLTSAQASTVQSQAATQQLDKLLTALPLPVAPAPEMLVRKLAHFAEFAVAGVLAALTLAALVPGARGSLLRSPHIGTAALAGLAVALCDETLQLSSPGRSAQVTDVWLDWAGYLTGILLCIGLLRLAVRRKDPVNDVKKAENQ